MTWQIPARVRGVTASSTRQLTYILIPSTVLLDITFFSKYSISSAVSFILSFCLLVIESNGALMVES
jgi:hypothetical protein